MAELDNSVLLPETRSSKNPDFILCLKIFLDLESLTSHGRLFNYTILYKSRLHINISDILPLVPYHLRTLKR